MRTPFTAANSGTAHIATIQAIDPQVDRETRSLVVRAVVDNVERELLPGNYARVQVPVIASNVIVVPSIAIVRSLGSVFVYVMESDKVVRTEASVGRRSADAVEILSGLETGDLVVTIGVQSLRDLLDLTAVADNLFKSRFETIPGVGRAV